MGKYTICWTSLQREWQNTISVKAETNTNHRCLEKETKGRKERKSFLFMSDEQTQNVSQLHGVALSMGSNNSPN